MMSISGVRRYSGWTGRDTLPQRGKVSSHSPRGYLLMGQGSLKKSLFLNRSSGEPTTAPGTITPAGVGTQNNTPAQHPSVAITELPGVLSDHVHRPHKALPLKRFWFLVF